MTLTQISWHGLDAWQLEDEHLRVIILPELGAKIGSLYDKHADREWLIAPRHALRHPTYGASYTDFEMVGWDEMFPTILACPYPVPGKHHGAALPDHGEVWSLPWQVLRDAEQPEMLVLSVEGRALPYRLTRSAALVGGGQMRLHYRAENLGDDPLPYLWAAHPLFTVDQSSQIVFPPKVSEVYNVFEMPAWGPAGTRYSWPQATIKSGQNWQLDRIGPPTKKDHHKFFLPPETSIATAGLVHHNTGTRLDLTWTSTEVPYVGVWVDEGAYLQEPTAAIEPSSAFYDGLDIAWRQQRYRSLSPRVPNEWDVVISLARGQLS